jgi:hypothetical protein
MQTALPARKRRSDVRSSPAGLDAAGDVRRARERLAGLSRLSEHATARAERAEFELVKALGDRRAGVAEVEGARRRLVDAQDTALVAFRQAQDAARAVTVLIRSIGGLPLGEPDFSDLLAFLPHRSDAAR